jgi:NitT/TauT family transport system substrate-binding protein
MNRTTAAPHHHTVQPHRSEGETMNRLRSTRTLIAVLAAVLALGACGGTDSSPVIDDASADGGTSASGEMTEVAVSEVIRSVFYAPMYVAAGAGIFADHGLDVSIETANGSDKVTAALLSRNADVGLLGPETAVFVRNQDSAQELTIFHQLTQRDGSFLVAREGVDDFGVEDLAGSTVLGWRPGSMPEMVMTDLLSSEGVDDVDYVTNLQAPAMAGAFTSGQGDYAQLFEPVVSSLVDAGEAEVVASVGELAGPFPYTVFASLESRADTDSELLERFSAAVQEAVSSIMENPATESAEALASFFPDTDVEMLASSIERYREIEAWALDPVVDRGQFDRMQDIMVGGGVLDDGDRVAYEELVDAGIAERAAEEGR